MSDVPDVLSAEREALHLTDSPTALCISGGGIRSATFALGALQRLADQGLLDTFDYLSTVSGGGYIGSWLTSWKHRAGGLAPVLPYLRTPAAELPPDAPDPIDHLREYSNYLSPKLGLFSIDAWSLAATVIGNMLLNWLVFLPLLAAILLVPRLALSLGRLGDTFVDYYPRLAQSIDYAELSTTLLALAALLFAVSIFNSMRYLPGVGGVRHSEFDFLRWVLLPLTLAALCFVTNDAWFTGGDRSKPDLNLPQLLSYSHVLLGAGASAAVAALACLAVCWKTLRNRLGMWFAVLLAVVAAGCIAGSAEWLLASYVYPTASWALYTVIAVPLLLLALLLAGQLFVGFSSRQLEDDDREWLSRMGAWMLLLIAIWSGFGCLVLFAPVWFLGLPAWAKSVFGGVGAGAGWISALAGRSAKTTGKAEDRSKLNSLVMSLAAPVFAIAALVGLAVLTNIGLTASGAVPVGWRDHIALLEATRVETIVLLGAALFLFATVMSQFININKFSLHAMYRNRLIRAYLGASNPKRNANPFTGFAESDNLPMCRLDPTQRPFHVVNVCLNLVSGKRLAWQQRKAESFTISPLHCGAANLGYQNSARYGSGDGITLGTAVAISGAAASPNMGYHSSPVVSFIMTLLNARLGAWLANPGPAGKGVWHKAGPTSALESLAREAFGLTDNTSRWVYLSDGGHFENLAMYEMIRRRCRYLLVLDGGCDPEFTYSDLGNALRKIRIDLHASVDFDEASFAALRKKTARCAVARVHYDDPASPDSWLIYVKPMIRGNESPDVGSYHDDHRDFPHETTANQFFNESQLESYRALGSQTIAEICEGWDGRNGLAGLVAHLKGKSKTAAAAS